jgi:hypothetical protein
MVVPPEISLAVLWAKSNQSSGNSLTLTDIANIAIVAGNVAIVITLAFLVMQLKDTRNTTAHANAYAQAQAMNAFHHLLFSHDGLASLYKKGRSEPSSLSPQEKDRFFYACVAFFSAHENLYIACQTKVMPPGYFDAWDRALREDLADPGFQEYWEQEGAYYDEPFRYYVDGVIAGLAEAQ